MKDPKLYLFHIKESIDTIQEYTRELDSTSWSVDRKTYHATLRLLQTMSESVKRLPDAIKAKYPQIKWQDIAGFRNVLVHDYLGDYDPHIIWNVIELKLPELKFIVEKEINNASR